MGGEFLQASTNQNDARNITEYFGFRSGKVIRNCDKTQKGRVLVRIASLNGTEKWARVVMPDTGVYFIPQVNDEVLVGPHDGDSNDLVILGTLWNDAKPPPDNGKKNPITQRTIQTPGKLELSFDDNDLSIIIKTKSGQQITLKPDCVEISLDKSNSAVIKLDGKGEINITANKSITLNAPDITLNASKNINIGNTSTPSIKIG